MAIIKKIDSLGRVVLPKSIRKNLKILNNTEVIIDVEDEKIVISKFNLLADNNEKINIIIESFKELLPKKADVILTDLNIVLNASNLEYKEIKITSKYLSLLKDRITFNEKIMPAFNPLGITSDLYLKYSVPIIIDSIVYGSLAIVSKDYNCSINDSMRSVIEFSKVLITKYMM